MATSGMVQLLTLALLPWTGLQMCGCRHRQLHMELPQMPQQKYQVLRQLQSPCCSPIWLHRRLQHLTPHFRGLVLDEVPKTQQLGPPLDTHCLPASKQRPLNHQVQQWLQQQQQQ